MGQRSKYVFFAFLCVSEQFESIEIHFFSWKLSWAPSAKCTRAKRARCERVYAAPECDTSDSDFLVLTYCFFDIVGYYVKFIAPQKVAAVCLYQNWCSSIKVIQNNSEVENSYWVTKRFFFSLMFSSISRSMEKIFKK